MKSVVLHAPVATLGAAATSRPTPTTTGKGRVTQVVPDAHGVATILVVGASRCGKSSLVNALLGAPAVAPAGGSALISIPRPAGRLATPSALAAPSAFAATGSAAGSTGPVPVPDAPSGARSAASTGSVSGAVAAGDPVGQAPAPAGALVVRPVTSAYLSFHHADSPAAFGYVPGHRGPRPLGLADLREGDQAAVVRGGPGRPPRRIDVLHPADLLRRVNLVDTPGVGGFDQVYTEIVLDALEGGAGLLFVADASAALQAAELDFLSQVEQREVPVIFALTKIDAHPEWPAVLSANLKLVHDHAPGLAAASWYALSTLPDRDTAPPAVVEEAALGLAGIGVAALRRGLAEPPPSELPTAEAPSARPGPAQRVSAAATDTRWSEVLDRELRSRAVAVGQRLAIDLATIHVRCVQETGGETGCARLPHVFDRELHALSVRTTNAIETAATEIMRLVFAEILDGEPDAAALARIRRATRRAIEDADSAPEWDRVLLVTATSGIAVTAGRGAVASLAAIRPRPLDEALLPPVGVGLSAGCYAAWRGGGDRKQCRSWLQQAIHVLEGSLERECTGRFDHLGEALSVVAADTIDHGVLLA
jgi:GTP-binding protein EngB required for normal cell division